MQSKYSEHGGGKATGLANDLIGFLSQGLNTGTFGPGRAMGTDAYGTTGGIGAALNDLLAGAGGSTGGGIMSMIQKNNDRQVLDTRARFGAQGGTAFGSGAQYAEGVQKAEAGPAMASAMGQLQLQTIFPLLQLMLGMGEKGIAQRQGVMQPSALAQGATLAAGGLQAVANLKTMGMGGGGVGSSSPFIVPSSIPYQGINTGIQNPTQIPWIMPSISNYGLPRS